MGSQRVRHSLATEQYPQQGRRAGLESFKVNRKSLLHIAAVTDCYKSSRMACESPPHTTNPTHELLWSETNAHMHSPHWQAWALVFLYNSMLWKRPKTGYPWLPASPHSASSRAESQELFQAWGPKPQSLEISSHLAPYRQEHKTSVLGAQRF